MWSKILEPLGAVRDDTPGVDEQALIELGTPAICHSPLSRVDGAITPKAAQNTSVLCRRSRSIRRLNALPWGCKPRPPVPPRNLGNTR